MPKPKRFYGRYALLSAYVLAGILSRLSGKQIRDRIRPILKEKQLNL